MSVILGNARMPVYWYLQAGSLASIWIIALVQSSSALRSRLQAKRENTGRRSMQGPLPSEGVAIICQCDIYFPKPMKFITFNQFPPKCPISVWET